jgi:hypothetical protein
MRERKEAQTARGPNVKRDTVVKVKFKRLQRQLKLPLWQAMGLLEALWHCTITNSPDGDIGRLSNDDIAAAIEWDEDADNLVNALVQTGWLDADDEFRLIVHDWSQHVPTYLKGAYEKHRKLFADQVAKQRAKQDIEQGAKQGAKQGASEGAGRCATYPSLTKPNLSKPSQTNVGAASPPTEESPKPPESPPRQIAEDVPIPVALDTQEFRASRDRWLARRRKKRWSVDVDHVTRQYQRLEPLGVANAIACMDLSTDNDYQALCVERFQNDGKPKHRPTTGAGQRFDPTADVGAGFRTDS